MPDVDARSIANYGYYLGDEASRTLPAIMEFAATEGFSTDGFDTSDRCLLKPIGEAINSHGVPVLHDATKLMQQKMCDIGDGFLDAAKHWGYADATNESVFERFRIEDPNNPGTGAFPDRYMGPTWQDAYDDGVGRFKLTELELTAPSRDERNIADELDGVLDGFILKALNWVWSQFTDETFYESMVEPLLGNFYSIRANGDAWKTVGKSFGDLANTMGTNATTLFTHAWHGGDDAEAAAVFIRKFWQHGAAAVGEELGDFLAEGFHKIADIIPDLIAACINGILKVIEMLAQKLIAYADPFVGVIEDVGKFIADILGFDTDTIIDEIHMVINLAQDLVKAFNGIRDIIEGIKAYIQAVNNLQDAINAIPDIKSTIAQIAGTRSDERMAKLSLRLGEEVTAEADSVSGTVKSIKAVGPSFEKGVGELEQAYKDLTGKAGGVDVSGDDVKGLIADAEKANEEAKREQSARNPGVNVPGPYGMAL